MLELDHINNDGAGHRRSLGRTIGNGKGASSVIYHWLKKQGFPKGIIQVLCASCNKAKSRMGACPGHKQSIQKNGVNSGDLSIETIPSQQVA